ncbi:hypothetical protein AB0368_09055 [Actinoplanes sp. NPDC051475]|uniref:hypothetical protein n=1 Tax=Actinoplanes sp. NPDC051475 TaxID=3157225 RepID=UPI00344BD75B
MRSTTPSETVLLNRWSRGPRNETAAEMISVTSFSVLLVCSAAFADVHVDMRRVPAGLDHLGYAGKLVDYAATVLGLSVQIVSELAGQTGLWCCPAGGAWNAPSPGSTGAAARPRLRTAARASRRDRLRSMIIVMGRRLARSNRHTRHSTTHPRAVNRLLTRLYRSSGIATAPG